MDALLVDNQLSPKQIRNLEEILECDVLDRTQLILEIFAKNARTREAKLQIMLAQSEYLFPRLVGLWKHLDRERGGIGASSIVCKSFRNSIVFAFSSFDM